MYKLQKYQFAMDLYELALDVFITLMGKDHLHTNRIYINLLHLGFILKSKDKIAYFEQKLLGSLEGQITAKSAIVYNEVANLFRNNKNYNKALKFYSQAMYMFPS